MLPGKRDFYRFCLARRSASHVNKEFWQQFQNYAPPSLRVIRTKFCMYHNWRASEASETLSCLFNWESRIYILGMCSFQHKWASERQLYLFVLLHHVIMKWNSVVYNCSSISVLILSFAIVQVCSIENRGYIYILYIYSKCKFCTLLSRIGVRV